jgi:succinyl-CoA synthetase beta subunit
VRFTSHCASTAANSGSKLLVAPEGGEDVEQTARLARIRAVDATTSAERIYPAIAKLFPPELAVRLARYAARLADIAWQEDLELLEINPLALTEDGRLVVCDASFATTAPGSVTMPMNFRPAGCSANGP